MQILHQKPLLDSDLPMCVFSSDDIEFPPHWHEAVEVVYALEDDIKVGIANELYTLKKHDILLISGGDIHCFLPQSIQAKRIIVLFEVEFFKEFTTIVNDKRFTILLKHGSHDINTSNGTSLHEAFEQQITEIVTEYNNKANGYKTVLKARLLDILVLILRYGPRQDYSPYEKNKQLNRLVKLEQVFKFVEKNFDRDINLEEAAAAANYSIYHFTRFFKSAIGMTYYQYVNNFRIAKAEEYLAHSNESIIDIAFKSGFGSIKTFDRVFKQIKGCSPSYYRKQFLSRDKQ